MSKEGKDGDGVIEFESEKQTKKIEFYQKMEQSLKRNILNEAALFLHGQLAH